MKQLIFALTIFVALSFNTSAQDGLVFKVQYKPQTKYTQTMLQRSNMNMKYSGSPEFLQKLTERGMSNPTISNTQTTVETVVKTGRSSNSGVTPLTMEFIKSTSSNGKKAIPDGTIIHGTVSEGKVPLLDSIVSEDLDPTFKAGLLQGLQTTFAQLSFPEKHVKVGESFTIDAPLSIPMAGVSIQMKTSSTYKLIGIKNGIADFDISQIYSVTSNGVGSDIKSSGNGTGKLTYDILNNFNVRLQMDVDMVMNMQMGGFGIDLKSNSGFTQTTVISGNK